jgi:hypothetical protein
MGLHNRACTTSGWFFVPVALHALLQILLHSPSHVMPAQFWCDHAHQQDFTPTHTASDCPAVANPQLLSLLTLVLYVVSCLALLRRITHV